MRFATFALLSLLLAGIAAPAQPQAAIPASQPVELPRADDGTLSAEVRLDGRSLFRVRGISALPARERAANILANIVAAADDPQVDPAQQRFTAVNGYYALYIDGQFIANLLPEDAAIEHVQLPVLAEVTVERVAQAISEYREARSTSRLLRATGVLVLFTLLAAALLYAVNALFRWFSRLTERAVKQRIEGLERASHRIIDAAQLWGFLGSLVRGLRAIALFAIVLTWLNAALGLYPWTRPFASDIFHLVLNPLEKMARGVVQSLPDLVFLFVLTFVVRFILRATHTFFLRIHRGWIHLENFDRDWALPTYRIVRILVIAFALVVAYPYIPGSDSEAFKGVSIFLGVVFSIGSSSFIANMIAGYSLTYRGAFREGDRVRIGEHVGEVVNVRALSTQLRSLKNEDVNIPNSEVLASAVVNYSTYSRDKGIILHTDVGIGYDTPWRQVEALLLMAAARTDGLEKEPPPFVLQTAMGDYTVVYQLNAFCKDATRMPALYSALHGNVQDVFNEYGVQIMSPSYEADPEAPKLVPPEQWYAAPASPPQPEG
ncbi:mechanosensitive ion channel [Mangrovimicrobium sediminis]|uniref:Small-conductance mechanosensitive channel n=1 Tax=Mangrovimicrobium sediminis TaxID=2562682 RepID=A0A4Z0M1T9_9GAMM|nr:mechanosensitive ion channel domain-containing protein [Haliea sp. SAOS-164]TGD73328.1 mechanosensitive ion channel [Haliea sp. SAOS-164]